MLDETLVKELSKQIEDISLRLKDALKKDQKPIEGHCVLGDGIIQFGHSTSPSFEAYNDQGRIFPTIEEARTFRDNERFLAKLRREFPKGNYVIHFIRASGGLSFNYHPNWVMLGSLRFTKPAALKCIEKYEKELESYFKSLL